MGGIIEELGVFFFMRDSRKVTYIALFNVVMMMAMKSTVPAAGVAGATRVEQLKAIDIYLL